MKTKTQTAEMQTARGREIAAILLKYHAERGISPEKLRLILQDLGPTFIKLGIFMEESKELQGFYKIFRAVIYISVLMEFFEYAIDQSLHLHHRYQDNNVSRSIPAGMASEP